MDRILPDTSYNLLIYYIYPEHSRMWLHWTSFLSPSSSGLHSFLIWENFVLPKVSFTAPPGAPSITSTTSFCRGDLKMWSKYGDCHGAIEPLHFLSVSHQKIGEALTSLMQPPCFDFFDHASGTLLAFTNRHSSYEQLWVIFTLILELKQFLGMA